MTTTNKSQRREIADVQGHAADPILNLAAVADALGRSPSTIGRWVTEGVLPSIAMPSGMRKVRKSTLVAWLKVNEFGADEGVLERVLEMQEE